MVEKCEAFNGVNLESVEDFKLRFENSEVGRSLQ